MKLDILKAQLFKLGISFLENEIMKNHTTFKIGGAVDVFITLGKKDELGAVIDLCNRCSVPYMVIGKGSNLLVSDFGIEGAVIRLPEDDFITVEGNAITCGAGVSLSNLCRVAAENSISGLEFAYGIPGTVGGALYMNAGAYGGEMKDVVISAEHIDKNGNLGIMSAEQMELGYRTSCYKKNDFIITSVTFKLKSESSENINAQMNDFISRRKAKQPLEFPSAGSTFKRPEGNFAGALIEQSGLRGVSVGGAQVSEKHCGFVINKNDATCSDVLGLVAKIKNTVFEKFGIMLEQEIVFVGREK